MHIWRDKARKVYEVWMEQFPGDSLAHDVARLVPPKCIAGRWGAISRCELRVLRPNLEQLRAIMLALFPKLRENGFGAGRTEW